MGLSDDLLAGSIRALARLATHVENDSEVGRVALRRLYHHTGKSHVVGITGAPGAGKSTLINALIGEFRESGRRVAVIAVDPSSRLTGGATLGDRIRIAERPTDPGVFVRSMASRGRHGGLAPATSGVIHLLDAFGFDVVIVETVGVGQDEVDVASHAHTVVVVQVPGLGDGVQAIKAGVLEIADIYAVNKADRDGAQDVSRELRGALMLGESRRKDGWVPPILKTVGSTGSGTPELRTAIDAHWTHLHEAGSIADRVAMIARAEIMSFALAEVTRVFMRSSAGQVGLDGLIQAVAARRMAPADAADSVLSTASFGQSQDA